jgi:type I restriction enzyme S subunit
VKAEIEPLFVLHVLRSDNLKIAYELNWTFGTQQTLGLRTISNLRIPIPPKEERQSIVKHLDSIIPLLESLIAEAQRAIGLLQERRAALISAAVTGKVDLRGLVPAEAEAA